jgi:hypothetical protein
LLVEAGADATLKDGEGLTPLDYAKEDGDAHDVVAFLVLAHFYPAPL